MRRETEAALNLRASEAEDMVVRETADAQNAEDRGHFITAADAYVTASVWRERAALIRATIRRGTVLSSKDEEAPRST